MMNIEKSLLLPSPFDTISSGIFSNNPLTIKRDDLIHPAISGNKWRKLQGVITNFDLEKNSSIVTFGGAFSNHILATAVTCGLAGIPCYGYIRTDKIDIDNPTLSLAHQHGMNLIAMSRSDYRNKEDDELLNSIKINIPKSIIIPEGGSTNDAIITVGNLIKELELQAGKADYYCCSYGTGATSLGILEAIDSSSTLMIFPAIKGLTQDSMMQTFEKLTGSELEKENYEIHYHPENRSYGKKDLELFRFIEQFYEDYGLMLDPIYTGKAMRSLMPLIGNEIEDKKTIHFVHSGGIQAWNGYFYLDKNLKNEIPLIYDFMQKFNEGLGIST